MKILIVEDDRYKERAIEEFINQQVDAEVRTRRSYQSGLKESVGWLPDLILLDMSMPTYDISATERGGRTRAFAGRDILHELRRRGVPSRAIVMTQFENFVESSGVITLTELKDELGKSYPNNYLGTIYYHPSQSSWQAELKTKIVDAFGITCLREIK